MHASAKALNLGKRSEGFRSKPYLCPALIWTQGWGHVVGRSDLPEIDRATGEAWLIQDYTIAGAAVERYINRQLTQGQFDALCDWTFNLGSGRLRGSALRQKVNRGEDADVPAEFRKWVWGGGKKLPGLILRRELEVALWLS